MDGRGMASAFHLANIPVGIIGTRAFEEPRGNANSDFNPVSRMPFLIEQNQRAKEIYQGQSKRNKCVVVNNSPPFANQMLEFGVNISRTMFETSGLNYQWVDWLFRNPSEIWVPSHWGAEVFSRCGIPENRVKVLANPTDFTHFDPSRADIKPLSLPMVPSEHKIFLSVFSYESQHKDWRGLIAAWVKAFDETDGVCLLLKTSTPTNENSQPQMVIEQFIKENFGSRELEKMAPIRFLNERLSDNELVMLYKACDAYVLPSHGEGWGKPLMEAMAMGLPTIGTNWGGSTEFMDSEFSWPLEGKIVPVDMRKIDPRLAMLYEGQSWFQTDIEMLADQMQEINKDWDSALKKASKARPTLQRRFGDKVLAEKARDMMVDAWDRLGWTTTTPNTVKLLGRWNHLSQSDSRLDDKILETAILEGATDKKINIRANSLADEDSQSARLDKQPRENHAAIGVVFDSQALPISDGLQVMICNRAPANIENCERWVDFFILDDQEIHGILAESNVPAQRIHLLEEMNADSILEAINSFESTQATPVQSLSPTHVDGRREFLAIHHPQWSDASEVFQVLDQWCGYVNQHLPITLALYCGSDEELDKAEAALDKWLTINTAPQAELPDITVVQGNQGSGFKNLAASCNLIITGIESIDSRRIAPTVSIDGASGWVRSIR